MKSELYEKWKYGIGGFHDDRDVDCGVLVMTFIVLLVVFQVNGLVLLRM
jgi:hypothetical protein